MKKKASPDQTIPEKRVKLERSDSPASSCVSLKSMEQPQNFSALTPQQSGVKLERAASPALSCLSLKSMEQPQNFSAFTPQHSGMKQEGSDLPTAGCVSLKSVGLSEHFKQELLPDSSDLTACLLTKNHFRCSVCTEVLKDPVSIPCGHSYCRQCISSYWAQSNHAALYACPQCSCPALYTNLALAQVVQKLQHFSPDPLAQRYLGPGDVACDFCTGRKLRAVKSCLTCMASYCESHVRQHYTVPALQKHTLVEPEDQEKKPKDQCNIKTDGIELFDQQSFAQSLDADPKLQQGTPDERVKLERSDSPASSCVSLKSMKQPQNFSALTPQQSGVKLERADSPALSCLSLKSMEQPQNFSAFTPQHSGVKMERSDSSAPSCWSLKSMDQPQNFKGELTPDSREKLERADSPALSCLSLKSMEQPQNFSSFTPQHSGILLIVDHFRCSVCTEVLKDPVSIPCGHSYCRQCISSYWAQPNHAGLYACPQCSRTYSSCPALYTNSALAQVVHKLQHISPVPPAQSCAAPGDAACDFCTGRKLRAVKSCLTCMASYCETHLKEQYIKEHYTVPVLRTHTLTECAHHKKKTLDIKCDIKTEELKQRQDEPVNQKPITKKLLDAKTEEMEHQRDTERGAPQPQVVSTGVGPVVQAQTEHQQQTQQTTEDPGIHPQPSNPQDELSAQDSVENPENSSEKQDKGQDSAPEKDPKEKRRLSIQRCIQSLVHAYQCRSASCSLLPCQKMKRVVQHIKGCKRKANGGCPVCKQLVALYCYHAKHCQENKCPVPFCLNIKHKLRQEQLQHRLQQAQMLRRRMAIMQRSGQTAVPGPEGSTSPSTPISSTQPVMPQMSKSLDNTLGHQPVMGGGSQAPQQQHPSTPPIHVSKSINCSSLQDLLRVLRSPPSSFQQQQVLNILHGNPQLMAAFIKQRTLKYQKTKK